MIFDEIRRAVHLEKRFLAEYKAPEALPSLSPMPLAELGRVQKRQPPPYLFKSGNLMEAVLRVEFSCDVHERIYHEADNEVRAFLHARMRDDVDGPWVVQGVSWYPVDNLPAPGWRVINPFRTA